MPRPDPVLHVPYLNLLSEIAAAIEELDPPP
jgi:hypothetical protein